MPTGQNKASKSGKENPYFNPFKMFRMPNMLKWKIGFGLAGVFLLLFILLFSREIGQLLDLIGAPAQKPGGPEIQLELNPISQPGGPLDELKYTIDVKIEHGTYVNAGDPTDPKIGDPLPFYGIITFNVDDLKAQYPQFIESAIITVPEEIPGKFTNRPEEPMITVIADLDNPPFGLGFYNHRLSPSDIDEAPDFGYISTPPILTVTLTDYALDNGGFIIPFQVGAIVNYLPALGVAGTEPPPDETPSVPNPIPADGEIILEGGLPPDFRVEVWAQDPDTLECLPPQKDIYIHWKETASYCIYVHSINDFAGEVILSAPDLQLSPYLPLVWILPNPITVTPDTPGFTILLVIPLEESTETVEFVDFAVIGKNVLDATHERQDFASLYISPALLDPNFTLEVIPEIHNPNPIDWGDTANFTISLVSENGFAGDIGLSSVELAGFLPDYFQDYTFSENPVPVDIANDINNPKEITLSIITKSVADFLPGLPPLLQKIPFIIDGISVSIPIPDDPAKHHDNGEVDIAYTPPAENFYLTMDGLTDQTVDPNLPNNFAKYTVRIVREFGFSGAVTLTANDLAAEPGIGSYSFLQVSPDVYELTVTASGIVFNADYPFYVKGTADINGIPTDRWAPNDTVNPYSQNSTPAYFRISSVPNYDIEIKPDDQTVEHDEIAMYTVSIVNKANGFNDPVLLTQDILNQYSTYLDDVYFVGGVTQIEITDTTQIYLDTKPNVSHDGFTFRIDGNSIPSGIQKFDEAILGINLPQEYSIQIVPDTRTVAPGGQTTYAINLDRLNGFNGDVTLTTNLGGMAGVSSAIFTDGVLNAGQVTTTLTVTANNPAADATHTFRVNGDTPNLNGSPAIRFDDAEFNIANTPDYSLEVTPPTITVFAGGTANYTVAINPVNSFNEAVQLTHDLLSTYGAYIESVTFDQNPITGTTIMHVTTRNGVTNPGINFIVTGNSNITNLVRTGGAELIIIAVQDYTITIVPDTRTVAPGGQTTYAINLDRLNGFNGDVTLTTNLGGMAGVSSAIFTDGVLNAGQVTTTLTVTANNPAADATHIFRVNGDTPNLNGSPAIRFDDAEFNIANTPDYSLEVTPPTITVFAGGTANYTVAINPVNSFNEAVQLTHDLLSTYGAYIESVTFDQNPITGTTIMHITTRNGVTNPGIDFIVTGNSNITNLVRTGGAELVIIAVQDYTITIVPDTRTVAPGGQITYAINLDRLNGFNGDVTLTTNLGGMAGVSSAIFTDGVLNAGQVTTTLTVTANNPAADATHIFRVNGDTPNLNGSPAIRFDDAEFNIANTPDYSLEVTPPTITVFAGGTANYTVAINPVNSFNEAVQLTHDLLSTYGAYIESVTFDQNPITGTTIMHVTTRNGVTNPGINFIVTGNSNITNLVRTGGAELVIIAVQDYTITIVPDTRTVAPGGQITYAINLDRLNGFNGDVTLTTNLGGMAGVSSAIFTDGVLNAGQVTTTLTVTANNPAADATHIFRVNGDTPNLNGSPAIRFDDAEFNIANTPDYYITIAPQTQTVAPGGQTTYSVSATRINRMSEPIFLTTNLTTTPGIASAIFADSTLDVGETSTTLTVTTLSSITPADINFIVNGASTINSISTNRQDSAVLRIVDYTITIDPNSQTTLPGGEVAYTINVERFNNMSENIDLSTNLSGMQYIESAVFDDSTLSESEPSTILRVVTISPAPDTTIGFDVNGSAIVGGSNLARSDSAELILFTPLVSDFTISVTPSLQTVDAGDSTEYDVTINRLNSFSETVVLSENLLSSFGDYIAGATFGLTELPNGTNTTKLFVITKEIDFDHLLQFTVTGTALDGNPTHSDNADLQILGVVAPPPPPPPPPSDFTIEITPNLQTVNAGEGTEYDILVTRLNGFDETIDLSENLLTDFSDYISQATLGLVTLPYEGFITHEIKLSLVTKEIAASHYLTFIVTGTAEDGDPIHSDAAGLQINVAAPPGGGTGPSPEPDPEPPTTGGTTLDYTIEVTPTSNTTINPGQTATYLVTIHRSGSFTGPVALTTDVLQLNPDIASAIFDRTIIPSGETTTNLTLTSCSPAIDSNTIFNVLGSSNEAGNRSDDAPIAIVNPLVETGPETNMWLMALLLGWFATLGYRMEFAQRKIQD